MVMWLLFIIQKRSWRGKGIALVVALGLSTPNFTYAGRDTQPPADNVIRGKKIFQKYCSNCHGLSGKGDGYRLLGPNPADLTSLATRQQSDRDLLKTIHQGKPNMPAWKYRLSKKDSGDVLAYIRSLDK
ncbi:MAG: putative Cytochrome c55x [Nitrospira sp.]|jgi:mono/diheme cytochrome c family protein|nr:putative Cytochrome c55x [Nitrospira sp.]